MSRLFSSVKLGGLELQNRFVRSATYECMAGENGEVTEELLKLYGNLAKGEIGLIISGYCFVNQSGKAVPNWQRQRKWESRWDYFSGEFGTSRSEHE